MCEQCGPVRPEIKEAYEKFDEAVKVFLDATGESLDIMTDWVLITAQTKLHEHGDSHSVDYEAPLGQPIFRTKGLLNEVLDNLRAWDVVHFIRRSE